MTASEHGTTPALDLHPRTIAAILVEDYQQAAVLHALAGIRRGQTVDCHLAPDGRPIWDTIYDLPLSSGEAVLRDVAWELDGHRPDHTSVLGRAVAWLDDRAYGRVIEAVGIRRGLHVTVGEEVAA